MRYLVVIAGWTVYAAIHSALASDAVKRRILGSYPRVYRLVYNVLSILLLWPIYEIHTEISASPLFGPFPAWFEIFLYCLQSLGVAIAGYGWVSHGWRSFVGLKNEVSVFIQGGAYRFVRHPLYSGCLVIIWSRPLTDIDFVHNVCITLYFVYGIFREEKKLVNQFGEKYIAYQQNVPMLCPGWRTARKSIDES